MASPGRASRFNLIVLAIGAIALVFVVRELGYGGMKRAVVGTGAWFGVIAAIDLASMMCDAVAIHGFLRPSIAISYWRVLGAQASGLAINRLTPGNSLGEPVKVTMLVRDVPTPLAVSAVVMFNLATVYLGAAVLVVGVPVTILLLDLPPRVELAVWIATGALVVLAVVVAVIVRRGTFGTLVDGAARARLISAKRAASWRAKIAEVDARVRELRGLRRGLIGVIGSRVFNSIGTVVVLRAADIEMTAPLVIAMLSVGILVTWLSNVIPLGLGLADGTNYALYGLLGASPEAGVLFTMVNRLRTCVIATIGLAIMAIANLAHRSRLQDERVTAAQPMQRSEAP